MTNRSEAKSLIHGHQLSVQFSDCLSEDRWYAYSPIEIDEESDLADTHPFEGRAQLPLVSHLLLVASMIDKKKNPDQPYMPYPETTIMEASKHLGHNGSLGIQGAILYWHEGDGIFTCTLIRSIQSVVLNWQEVIDLIRANYLP
jgi:hypothetical protein